jgi:hypothetical protein
MIIIFSIYIVYTFGCTWRAYWTSCYGFRLKLCLNFCSLRFVLHDLPTYSTLMPLLRLYLIKPDKYETSLQTVVCGSFPPHSLEVQMFASSSYDQITYATRMRGVTPSCRWLPSKPTSEACFSTLVGGYQHFGGTCNVATAGWTETLVLISRSTISIYYRQY